MATETKQTVAAQMAELTVAHHRSLYDRLLTSVRRDAKIGYYRSTVMGGADGVTDDSVRYLMHMFAHDGFRVTPSPDSRGFVVDWTNVSTQLSN